MLKIKEDKMQELEKFGFKKGKYIYYYDIYKNYGLYVTIEITSNRTIILDVNCDGSWFDNELDILYELFANNMIEKVEE